MYNLFATSYMLWFFKPVRNLMLQDLANICLIDVRSTTITSHAINWEKEREGRVIMGVLLIYLSLDHFHYLNTYWNQPPTTSKHSNSYQ